MERIYADHAAATPTDPRVIEVMMPYFADIFGNPSSAHSFGWQASEAINRSKKTVAELINTDSEDIYFTGSGSESNNLAILGVAKANKAKGRHIITTEIEHPSIINTCRALENDGFEVSYLKVDQDGQIDLNDLRQTITEQTILVTTHFGNSEIGTLFNIKAIGAMCREFGVLFHVDACQSIAYLPVDVEESCIDLLTFNGSKVYGPKGVAVLYVRQGTEIFPIIYGGGQQKSLRSGTENVPGIVGLAEAVKIVSVQREQDFEKVLALRQELEGLLVDEPGVVLNVEKNRLPNHLSIRLENRTNADLVREMDKLGIAVSAGSACSSTAIVDSHILRGIGLTSSQTQSTLRITLGRGNTAEDIAAIASAVKQLSAVSL